MQLDFAISPAELRALRHGAALVPGQVAVFRVEGPGALACLQGLLTCDLAAAGDNGLSYGALLTPKGMIVVDPWVLHEGEGFTLVIDVAGREPAAQLLHRVLPPRLARVTELSDAWRALWLLGACAPERFARANGTTLPGAGRVIGLGPTGAGLAAGGSAGAPFHGLVVGPAEELKELLGHAEQAGLKRGEESLLAAARVLAGWPTLGREIDERTLPQEVRYDELGAVSYVKGCYTGQETVARVHFRGHVNRVLRGVRIGGGAALPERTLKSGDKDVGTVRTAIALDDHLLALAVVRRELEAGMPLRVGDRKVELIPLPVAPD